MAVDLEDSPAVELSKGREEKKNIKIEAGSAPVVDTMSKKTVGKDVKEWNTKNLSQRLVVDAGCAATAGFLVAPIVSMVDK